MDVELAQFGEIDRTLRDLATINRLTLAYRPTLGWLNRVIRASDGMPLSILDVGCGHGDMLRRIERWAQNRSLPVALTGIDISADVVRSAVEATPRSSLIRYEVRDVFSLSEKPVYDVVISSLFTHHLFDDTLTRFIAWMNCSARRSWLVNDLHRHAIPYYFVRAWVRHAGFSRFVVHDAPVSVARGFTRGDWLDVLAQAGVDSACVDIRWRFPFRYQVGCLR